MLILYSILLFGLSFAGPKADALKVLGKFSYEVDYFPEDKFQNLELGAGQTERGTLDPSYQEIYQRYLAYGLKAQIQEQSLRTPASLTTFKEKNESLLFPVPQNLGLIAFKRGDLAAACPKVVQSAKDLGIERIAYYHPVHFSGGNSKIYSMPENPKYDVHWRYEIANNFSQQEFDSCLDLVASAGLKLHYIPHLESIAALIGVEEEWRMLSGIPIDNWYFHHAFGPLLTYLKKHPKNFRTAGAIDVTLAAEIDPMIFVHARKVRGGMAWLKDQFSILGYQGAKYYINTNGDFHHGKSLIPPKSLQCDEISKLLTEVDGLTPSMYGDKGHLRKKNGKLDLGLTISSYKDALKSHLISLCPGEREGMESLVSSLKIGFGEFAVDENDREQSYRDVLAEAKGQLLFVQYWNHGKWDHLGVLEDKTPLLRQELVTSKARTK